MADYSIQKTRTNSKFVVMKDGSPMASCYSYQQAYQVLGRMQLNDAINSINTKYDKKKRRATAITALCCIVIVSIVVLGLILDNQ
jgi:hypothetical protein